VDLAVPGSIHTFAERPDLVAPSHQVMAAGWPDFILASQVAARHWPRVLAEFAAYQVALVDPTSGAVIGVGHSVPLVWDQTAAGLPAGWDDTLERAVADHDQRQTPTAAAALSITLAASHLRQGLSRHLIQALRTVAAAHGLASLVAPVRPSLKSRYPLTPMERYLRWTDPEGAPFDPWLRVHWRMGGESLGVCAASMRITGSVADWEQWTDMRFPESGSYIVPGALTPVHIDRERDLGGYVEPNVWIHHRRGAHGQ